MRVLLVKTSSMGDLIHVLPALTDAGSALPDISFDWLVEENFTVIPAWHPLVKNVIPVALRRWRKNIFSANTRAEWHLLRQQLQQPYDLVLDAQGLMKSALLTLFTKGTRVGLDWGSARERFAALCYQRTCQVNFYQHAVVRMRSLFSQALGYALPDTPPDFGIPRQLFQTASSAQQPEKYLVFLHGTTWVTKQWPESYWITLAQTAAQAGYRIKISGGSAEELARAERIAAHCNVVDVLPDLRIADMPALLVHAKAAIAVDTGFGHLAAALGVPTVSLYSSTDPAYTGALGPISAHLSAHFPCAPCLSRTCTYRKPAVVFPACFETVPPEMVWAQVEKVL
ncbi:MAG TPA: lipopolysaccharide heptosyltransferase I [Gammaproteobacteria bacterium]|jgi:heptosyltransferase-1|nr:lipopolysaccharide heptosyltransferase I [Gammaproteobacteria bacterium]